MQREVKGQTHEDEERPSKKGRPWILREQRRNDHITGGEEGYEGNEANGMVNRTLLTVELQRSEIGRSRFSLGTAATDRQAVRRPGSCVSLGYTRVQIDTPRMPQILAMLWHLHTTSRMPIRLSGTGLEVHPRRIRCTVPYQQKIIIS